MGKGYGITKKVVATALAVGIGGWFASGIRHVPKGEAIVVRQVLQTKNGLVGPTIDPYKRVGIQKENGGWTYIQPIGLGVVEEYIKMSEPQKAEAKFAYFTKDWITGEEEDKGHVRAFKIDLEVKINDIEKYARIDPEIYNDNPQLNPTGKKLERGVDYIAELIESEFMGLPPSQQNPNGSGLIPQLALLDLQVRSRFDIISNILTNAEDLKTPEEKIKFYKDYVEERPWLKINAALLQEYAQQGAQLTMAAQQGQQVSPEYMLPFMIYQAFALDQQKAQVLEGKAQLDGYRAKIEQLPEAQRKAALLYLKQQEQGLDEQLKQMEQYEKMQLLPFFKTTLEQNPTLVDEEVVNYALEKNVNTDFSKIDVNDQKAVTKFVQGLVGPIIEKKVTGKYFKEFMEGFHQADYEENLGISIEAKIEVINDSLFTSGGTVNTEYMNVYQNLEQQAELEQKLEQKEVKEKVEEKTE